MNKPIYCPPFTPVVKYLPEGSNDDWVIEHFGTNAEDVKDRKMRSLFAHNYGLYFDLVPGRYARLLDLHSAFSSTVMTDTPMERRTNLEIVDRAHGDVLIAGLGLGMIIVPIMAKAEVKTVTVVEISQSLIDLVSPHVSKMPGHKKLFVVTADIMDFWPGSTVRFNIIYFDIWANMNIDNLEPMAASNEQGGS